MQDRRLLLSGVLVLQLALALGLYWQQQGAANGSPGEPLLAVTSAQLDRIQLQDGAHNAELVREQAGWNLSGSNLPADGSKVDTALERLADIQLGWPLARTDASHERFEVADDSFQRRLLLFAGDRPAGEIYLGTSPGFRKVHLRRAGEDAVYAAELNTYDLPADPDQWLDKTLLSVPAAARIEGPDYTLVKADAGWQLLPSPAGPEKVESSAVDALADAVTGLRVQGVAEPGMPGSPDPETEAATGPVSIEITGTDTAHRLEFVHSGESYYVRRDDREQWFRLSQYDYNRIAGQARSQLLVQQEDTEGGGPGDSASGEET